jgi:hypothetical protein
VASVSTWAGGDRPDSWASGSATLAQLAALAQGHGDGCAAECCRAAADTHVHALALALLLRCHAAVPCSAVLRCPAAMPCCSVVLRCRAAVPCCAAVLRCHAAVPCCSAALGSHGWLLLQCGAPHVLHAVVHGRVWHAACPAPRNERVPHVAIAQVQDCLCIRVWSGAAVGRGALALLTELTGRG